MAVRESTARWSGALKDGSGTMRLGSGAFEGPYSYPSRFENGAGTNPEELIGAAHAGCYSMALAAGLGKAGFTPSSIATTARVHFGASGGVVAISRIDLETAATVPGIDGDTFQKIAAETKEICPVSKALAGVEITLSARLG